jgi:hypothetical protein
MKLPHSSLSLSSLSSLSQTSYGLCWLWLCFSLSACLYRQTNKHTPHTAGNLQKFGKGFAVVSVAVQPLVNSP